MTTDRAAESRMLEARARVRELMPVEGDVCFRRRCETILEWLDPQPGETVLDCGCGFGFTLNLLHVLTEAHLIGLDLQAVRLSDARDRLGDRVTLVQGSAQSLPFADNSLPKAVCSEVLEHLPDDASAAAELYRVLEPGGSLVVTVPSSAYPWGWDPFNWTLERVGRSPIAGERTFSGIWYGHQSLYSTSELTCLLSGAGFEVISTRSLTHWVPPASHLVMYGILKPLLTRGVLPSGLANAGDRLGPAKRPSRLVALAAEALNRLDRKNDDPAIESKVESFVAIAALARKPTR